MGLPMPEDLLAYLAETAFGGRRVAWGRVRSDGRGGAGGGDREAFAWPKSRGLPRGVTMTLQLDEPAVLRGVPIEGEVDRADLHLVPGAQGLWCLAVEREEGESTLAGARGGEGATRDIEKQDILLHTIVHDLASPLSGIVGCLNALEEGVDNPDDHARLLELALRQAHRQEQLIRQILDVFRARSDGEDDTRAAVPPDLSRTVLQLVESLEPSFTLHGVVLRLEDRLPKGFRRVIGEQSRLERVLANLLDNGLRHAPEGSTVEVSLEGDERRAIVSVLDQGPGVPEDRTSELFQKLRQGESRGKLGLGLYFCRITVQRWGGNIGYTPRSEGGARFWFELPWAR